MQEPISRDGKEVNVFVQKQKEKVFKNCLLQGAALVVIYTIHPGVIIPKDITYIEQDDLKIPIARINFSQRFANTLSWDKDAIHQLLNFGTYTFDVTIPWPAVVAIISKDKKIQQTWAYEPEEG